MTTAPYMPVQFAAPIISPLLAPAGPLPVPYVSPSEYQFAPTAMDAKNVSPGGNAGQSLQAISDSITDACDWMNEIVFGADAASKGISLAANISVENGYVKNRRGGLGLLCDARPVLVTGVDIGPNPANVQSIGASVAASTRTGRRTIYVPFGWAAFGPNGDYGNPGWGYGGGPVYAVWSYINGYPHTLLVDSVEQGATSCVVQQTDGNGGLLLVYPGTSLTVRDGANTEVVKVLSVTPGIDTATLATSVFRNPHTVPDLPDFLTVSGLPRNVRRAAIFMTTMLLKTRGARALVMSSTAGGRPARQAPGQAGVTEDYEIACKMLQAYRIHQKRSG